MTIEITQNILKELLNYDPNTGLLTWKARSERWFRNAKSSKAWNKKHAGKVAGSITHIQSSSLSYVRIKILGKNILAHRLAWMLVHGAWPEHVDHINGCGTDNRMCNIRSVQPATNLRNKKLHMNNKSGIPGVAWEVDRSKWRAEISINGKMKRLGSFPDKFDAICARKSAENRYGFHPNHGRDPVAA